MKRRQQHIHTYTKGKCYILKRIKYSWNGSRVRRQMCKLYSIVFIHTLELLSIRNWSNFALTSQIYKKVEDITFVSMSVKLSSNKWLYIHDCKQASGSGTLRVSWFDTFFFRSSFSVKFHLTHLNLWQAVSSMTYDNWAITANTQTK